MTLRYGSFQAVPGGGSTSAVNSVNGKTGDVLLSSDDLNAQKKTSALPVGTADINDEVAFQQGGVSLRTAIENLPISLATRQALLGKLDASQKGTANGVAELDASGKLPVNRLPDAALGGLAYQGGWNAATNTPALTSPALRGYYWVVTTAGNTNLGGVTDWQVGDWVISNGAAWQKIDQTDVVTSVNGKQGAVVLNAADVGAQPVDATLTALAGLVAAANKLAYFTGDDQMALADFTAFARTLLSSVDAAAARTVLDAQKSDATLTALAGLATGTDKFPYSTGTDIFAQADLTSFARTLLDDTNAKTARVTLSAFGNFGVSTETDLNAYVEPGSYVTPTANTCSNGPEPSQSARYHLLVESSGDGGYIHQRCRLVNTIGTNTSTEWCRTRYTTTNPIWSNWVATINSSNSAYPTSEIGTFTPVAVGGTLAGSATYTIQTGSYTRIGNIVFYSARVVWTGHTGSGELRVSGLPFVAAANPSRSQHGGVLIGGVTFTGTPICIVSNGTSYVRIGLNASGANFSTLSIPASVSNFEVSGFYYI